MHVLMCLYVNVHAIYVEAKDLVVSISQTSPPPLFYDRTSSWLLTLQVGMWCVTKLVLGRHYTYTSPHPPEEPATDQSIGTTTVQLNEPMSFIKVTYRNV